jgi:hypothetical protein
MTQNQIPTEKARVIQNEKPADVKIKGRNNADQPFPYQIAYNEPVLAKITANSVFYAAKTFNAARSMKQTKSLTEQKLRHRVFRHSRLHEAVLAQN